MQRLQKKPGDLKSGGSNTKANHFNFGPDLIGLRNTLILNVRFHIMKCYLPFRGKKKQHLHRQRWSKNDPRKNKHRTGDCCFNWPSTYTRGMWDCVCVSACMGALGGLTVRSEQAPRTFIISWLKESASLMLIVALKKAAALSSGSFSMLN